MLVEQLINLIVSIISSTGYFGVFLMMAFESMILPIPSEAVMPFAGFLISEGKFTFFYIFIVSSLGSLVGSLISYYIGVFGSETFIPKYGKYFFLNHHHLEITKNYFNKHGPKTVFICRFIPVIRHLISIPAGIAEMNIKKFMLYTFIGASIWNMFLAYVGFKLKQNWGVLDGYTSILDIIVIILIIIFIVYKFIKIYKKRLDV